MITLYWHRLVGLLSCGVASLLSMIPVLTNAYTQTNPYYYGRPRVQDVIPFPDPRVGGILAGIMGKVFFWRRWER